jgi:hypothetical protein
MGVGLWRVRRSEKRASLVVHGAKVAKLPLKIFRPDDPAALAETGELAGKRSATVSAHNETSSFRLS